MAKTLLIDGHNFAYRAFYGITELSRSDGFPTNAIHGWLRTCWRLEDEEKPDAIIVFLIAEVTMSARNYCPSTRPIVRNARMIYLSNCLG